MTLILGDLTIDRIIDIEPFTPPLGRLFGGHAAVRSRLGDGRAVAQ